MKVIEVKRLSRADILSGRRREHVFCVEELGGEIVLRPLADGQWAQVMAVKSAGGKLTGRPVMDKFGNVDRKASGESMLVEIDLKTATEQEYEADCLAVAYSLSDTRPGGETWTVNDVKRMEPPGVVKKIAMKVYAITGVSKEAVDWASSFRADGRGSADSPVTPDGVSLGADTGGSYTTAESVLDGCDPEGYERSAGP